MKPGLGGRLAAFESGRRFERKLREGRMLDVKPGKESSEYKAVLMAVSAEVLLPGLEKVAGMGPGDGLPSGVIVAVAALYALLRIWLKVSMAKSSSSIAAAEAIKKAAEVDAKLGK